MKNFIPQPFHLTLNSPWPLIMSLSLMFSMIGFIKFSNISNIHLFLISYILIMITLYQWWRDVIRESTYQGYHTISMINSLKFGMILFIISEVMFFLSFFWSYFHAFLSPNIELGSTWPPFGMKYILINPYFLPLLNSILLVSSGMFLTLAHYQLKSFKENLNKIKINMMITLILGYIFSFIQMYEYITSSFSINDSIYGTIFFMMTGFHGIHVIIGTIFISTMFIRLYKNEQSNNHHLGFEASAWYWHFVDVIWLLLFLSIYWWPF